MWTQGAASKKRAGEVSGCSMQVAEDEPGKVWRQEAEREESATASSRTDCQHFKCKFFNFSTENKCFSSKPPFHSSPTQPCPYSPKTIKPMIQQCEILANLKFFLLSSRPKTFEQETM